MLNKVLVAKFVTAMTLAAMATGAAAGFDGDEPVDDGEDIELEAPASDDDSDDDTTDSDDDSDDDSDESDSDEEDGDDGSDSDESDSDESDSDSDDGDDSDDSDEDLVQGHDADEPADVEPEDGNDETRPDNHGAVVSDCAHNTELTGRDRGQVVAAVARGDSDTCDSAPSDDAESDSEDEDEDGGEGEAPAEKGRSDEHRPDRSRR